MKTTWLAHFFLKPLESHYEFHLGRRNQDGDLHIIDEVGHQKCPELKKIERGDSSRWLMLLSPEQIKAIVNAAADVGILPDKIETIKEERALLDDQIKRLDLEVGFGRKIINRLTKKIPSEFKFMHQEIKKNN